jgi:hypothetical protein
MLSKTGYTTAIFMILGLCMASHASANDLTGFDLDAYLWEKRPLVLFAPAPEDLDYRRVAGDLDRRRAEIDDRHMVIIAVFETGAVWIDGLRSPRARAEHMRERLGASAGELTAVLVGKDGGIKLRQNGTIDLGDIFARVDTMPMRRQEMGSNGK